MVLERTTAAVAVISDIVQQNSNYVLTFVLLKNIQIRARECTNLKIIAEFDRHAVKRVGDIGAANVGQQFVGALGSQLALAELLDAAAVRLDVGDQAGGLRGAREHVGWVNVTS